MSAKTGQDHLTSAPSRDVVTAARQLITQDWWETQKSSFDVYILAAVAQEFLEGDASAVPGLQVAMGDFKDETTKNDQGQNDQGHA